jgi:hypothetical protein
VVLAYDTPVAQSLPTGYVLDPNDPRAPSVEQWERMLPDERACVVAMLPEEVERQLADARAEIDRLRKGTS